MRLVKNNIYTLNPYRDVSFLQGEVWVVHTSPTNEVALIARRDSPKSDWGYYTWVKQEKFMPNILAVVGRMERTWYGKNKVRYL